MDVFVVEQACAYPELARDITISAQTYLTAFYRSHGFVPVSEAYLEDGIDHIDMTHNQA